MRFSLKDALALGLLALAASCAGYAPFPNARPAPATIQNIADRVAGTHLPIQIWGSANDQGAIALSSYDPANDRILIHVSLTELLRDEPDLMAFMIGHEVWHAYQRGVQRGQKTELEADVAGVLLARRAGFDAVRATRLACALFFKVGGSDPDHPPPIKRCAVMLNALAQKRP